MQSFRFSSGGSPVELFAGAAFNSLPGIVLAYVLYAGVGVAAWMLFLLMLVYGLAVLGVGRVGGQVIRAEAPTRLKAAVRRPHG